MPRKNLSDKMITTGDLLFEYPKEWENCYLVLFYEDVDLKSFNKTSRRVTYFKPIARAKNKEGVLLDFFGVRSGIYGINLNPLTTHWSICVLGVADPKILVEAPIPQTMTVQETNVDENTQISLVRYNKNMKFTIGKPYAQRRTKKNPTQSNIVQEDVFTVEESLELLFS